jgi:hypothetical protein
VVRQAFPRASAGTVASTKTEQAAGTSSPAWITGMNTPALLCATSTTGSPGAIPARAAFTAATTPGQYGASPCLTPSSDVTTTPWPDSRSLPATPAQVAGPTDGLCTRTKLVMPRLCQVQMTSSPRAAVPSLTAEPIRPAAVSALGRDTPAAQATREGAWLARSAGP